MVLRKLSIITSRNVVWLNKTYGDFMQITVSESSSFIDPIPDLDDDEYLGIEILCGVRENQVYNCTRCGRLGHGAADCFQLRSASHDSDSDNDDHPITPIRNQPPLIPVIPEEVTADDTNGKADSISAHIDTDTDSIASYIPRVTTFYNPDPALPADIEDNEDANFAMMTFMNVQHYALASLGAI
jgi:hypothetical protein